MTYVEEPVVTTKSGPGGGDEQVTTHPAYVQVGAYRTQGGHRTLYDSDFVHNAVISLRIVKSELHRSLSRDWHFGREEIVEVAMSESQWAHMISTMNSGSGVPATLQSFNGQQIPQIPPPVTRTEQYADEMKKVVGESLESLKELMADIDGLGLSAKKAAALRLKLRVAHDHLKSNIPFIAESFDTHMEGTIDKGKAEIHGYMTGYIQRAGLDAIASGAVSPLQLEKKED